MEDKHVLMDEPPFMEIPQSEYFGTALLLIILAAGVASFTYFAGIWLQESFWFRAVMLLAWSVFGLALVMLIDLLPHKKPH